MIKFALTGNIASGKSEVEKVLKELGYPVLDTDRTCHKLLDILPEIKNEFKDFDVFDDGIVSREKLGTLVFSNTELKRRLEDILYPELRKKIQAFFEYYKNENLTFVAIPLVFEAGMEDLFDKIMLVYSPDEMRFERLIARNNYTQEYAKIRMESQMSQDEKAKKSDIVLLNDSTLDDLRDRVRFIIEQIR